MSGNFPENKEFYRAGALGQIHYMSVMAIQVVEFSNGGYKIRNIFA